MTHDTDYQNPAVWGPPFWFVMHSVADTYPDHPTDGMKKKTYEFFYNLPLFIPSERAGNRFSEMLDEYPLSPYLDSRRSLRRWVHFMHNRVNERLGKSVLSMKESERQKAQVISAAVTPSTPMQTRWMSAAALGGCVMVALWLQSRTQLPVREF
jgi:hypothetical protein